MNYELSEPIYKSHSYVSYKKEVFVQPAIKPLVQPLVNPVQKNIQKTANDFWDAIHKLDWHDRESLQPPRIQNPTSLKSVLHDDEIALINRDFTKYYNALELRFRQQDWFGKNVIRNDLAKEMMYHIIARGKQVYESIMEDVDFAYGFIGQQCGFDKLV
jgi:hypothetical protein